MAVHECCGCSCYVCKGGHGAGRHTVPCEARLLEEDAETQAIIAKMDAGEIEPVVLDVDDDGKPTLLCTPEVMDEFLSDPDEAAEIINQINEFVRNLPDDLEEF